MAKGAPVKETEVAPRGSLRGGPESARPKVDRAPSRLISLLCPNDHNDEQFDKGDARYGTR